MTYLFGCNARQGDTRQTVEFAITTDRDIPFANHPEQYKAIFAGSFNGSRIAVKTENDGVLYTKEKLAEIRAQILKQHNSAKDWTILTCKLADRIAKREKLDYDFPGGPKAIADQLTTDAMGSAVAEQQCHAALQLIDALLEGRATFDPSISFDD